MAKRERETTMSVTLHLAPEIERRLSEIAACEGQTLEAYLEQLAERAAMDANGSPSDEQSRRTGAKSGREKDVITARDLRKITPSNDELLRAAKTFPPPPEWFEEDQERPF
jgi:hypothetical protein